MKTKRYVINAILIVLLLTTVLISRSYGQVDVLTNLRNKIEQNEELLKEAEGLVRSTNSVKARTSLEAARKLHEASKTLFTTNRFVLAANSANQAREAILRTIAIAKREAKLEENALKAIEQASVRIERAQSLLDEQDQSGDQPAKKLIGESRQQLERAKNNMREHMFEVALRLANASIEMSNRAIRMLKRDNVLPDRVLREIARTDRLLERADELSGRPFPRILQEAHNLQDSAKRGAQETRFRLALEQTQRARTLARRVLKTATRTEDTGKEETARAIALTDRLLEQAYEIAREQGGDRWIEKLDEAARIQREAKDRYENRQFQAALRLTLRAREIIKDTMRAVDKPIDAGKVQQTLVETDKILAGVRSNLEGQANTAAQSLFDRAAARQAAAWESFDSGAMRKALANSKIARNLAKQAQRLL